MILKSKHVLERVTQDYILQNYKVQIFFGKLLIIDKNIDFLFKWIISLLLSGIACPHN